MAVSFGMLDDIKDIKKIIKVSSTYKPESRKPRSIPKTAASV